MEHTPEDFPELTHCAGPGMAVHGAPFGGVIMAESWADAEQWCADMAAAGVNGAAAAGLAQEVTSRFNREWTEAGPGDKTKADVVRNLGMRVRTVPDAVRKAVQEAMPDLEAEVIRRVRVWADRNPGRFNVHRWASGDTRCFRTRRRKSVAVKSVALVLQSAALGDVSTEAMTARGLVLGVVADILQDAGYAVEVWSAGWSRDACAMAPSVGVRGTSLLTLVKTVHRGEVFNDTTVMNAGSAAAFRAGHLNIRGAFPAGITSGRTRHDLRTTEAARYAVEHLSEIDAAVLCGYVPTDMDDARSAAFGTIKDVLSALEEAGIANA